MLRTWEILCLGVVTLAIGSLLTVLGVWATAAF